LCGDERGSCRRPNVTKLSKHTLIAVVDDDESVREAMRNLILLLGYAVESFASAEEFLSYDRIGEVACLVTDVQMSGMSGIQLHDQMLVNGDRKPVIFVTAFPQEGVRARVLRDGAIGYLSKPLKPKCFIACLHRAIGDTISGLA